jgi:hypothetical protein
MPLYSRCIAQGVAEGLFRVRDPDLTADLFLGAVLSLTDRISGLYIAWSEGDAAALDRLTSIYEAVEQALERLLGAAEGSLPIYTSTDIRGLLDRIGEPR